jgi:hypothetical protein
MMMVPDPGPRTGVDVATVAVADGAEGAVGVLLLPHPALTTARTAAMGRDKRCIQSRVEGAGAFIADFEWEA